MREDSTTNPERPTLGTLEGINEIKKLGNPNAVLGIAGSGIRTSKAFGVYVPQLRKIAATALRELTAPRVQIRLKGSGREASLEADMHDFHGL
jgi:hypothetical protein